LRLRQNASARTSAGVFAIHGKYARKRTHVSPKLALRIFVVNDQRVIASALATVLQMNGFSARFFTHSLDALAAARSEAPDLLISDVTMPDLSGVELAIRMKEQCPACEVLLFSGHASNVALLRTAREGGHNFHLLCKQVHPNDLLSDVGKEKPCLVAG
jgi:DNA-binding NtrC family response regulator